MIKKDISASFVRRLTHISPNSIFIWRHILGRNHINVTNVTNLLQKIVILQYISGHTLGRIYISVVNVTRLFQRNVILHNI